MFDPRSNMTICPETKAMVFVQPKHIKEQKEVNLKVGDLTEVIEKMAVENAKLKELVLLMASCYPKPKTKAGDTNEDVRYTTIQNLANQLGA